MVNQPSEWERAVMEAALTITTTGANISELCTEAQWVDEQGRTIVASAYTGTVEATTVGIGGAQ